MKSKLLFFILFCAIVARVNAQAPNTLRIFINGDSTSHLIRTIDDIQTGAIRTLITRFIDDETEDFCNIDSVQFVYEEELMGLDYVFDPTVIPELHISVSVSEWQRLLAMYDKNNHTKQYIACSALYKKGHDVTLIDSCGLRLRGNTSRRRPQDNNGNFRHCHFAINFRKYVKDDAHTVSTVRKLNLKWFKDDPTYVRELFCYDLFRRFGVWTGPHDTYCRLFLRVGDGNEVYYGVYNMIEPVDENYLKARRNEGFLSDAKGNLWKCEYGAGLNNTNADFWYDDDSDDDHTYTLQTNKSEFDEAKEQLIDFMLKLNGKGDASFAQWIAQVCDVDLLLKTYAVNVAVGMWDDYWNNQNNYYLYFSTTDKYDYKFYFIPFDYDNTLGTSSNCGNQSDAGRQDPYNWGQHQFPLIRRILNISEYREKYHQYLLQLTTDGLDLMGVNDATARVLAWQERIRQYVSNDTGEDMIIEDRPASWGNHNEYRIMDVNSPNNFFRIKASSIGR